MARTVAAEEARTDAIGALRALLGERLSLAGAARAAHGRDESWHPVAMPDAVAFAVSTQEVVAITRICAANVALISTRSAPRMACRSSPSVQARRSKVMCPPCMAACRSILAG